MSDNSQHKQTYRYLPGMSRRESLKWLSLLAASAALPGLTACASKNPLMKTVNAGHWPQRKIATINAKGYGQDPDLIMPPESPWPRTLTSAQLTLVAVLSDILLPRDGVIPSASEVNVPDVVDEWVSAPYVTQQQDRTTILATLGWIDDEADLRYQQYFVALTTHQRLTIMDDIAYLSGHTPNEFSRITAAFARFRELVLAAFFCSPQGTKEIGYLGNVPIAGDYPGPSDEALKHLEQVLATLGLEHYAYTEPR